MSLGDYLRELADVCDNDRGIVAVGIIAAGDIRLHLGCSHPKEQSEAFLLVQRALANAQLPSRVDVTELERIIGEAS